MAGSRKKRTGASRKKSRAATKVPARLWLAAGVAISALIFGLNSLLPHIDEKPDVASLNSNSGKSRSVNEKPKEPVFDFYTLLPESEVLTSGESSVPEKPKNRPKPKVKHSPKPSQSKPAVGHEKICIGT